MTPTADLMRLVEKWREWAAEMSRNGQACVPNSYRVCADELAAALTATGEALAGCQRFEFGPYGMSQNREGNWIQRDEILRWMSAMSATRCTCPSGDGSLRWPCPQHPAQPAEAGKVRDRLLVEAICKLQFMDEHRGLRLHVDVEKLLRHYNEARDALSQAEQAKEK